MKIKKIISTMLTMAMVLAVPICANATSTATMTLNKSTYVRGESITISFTGAQNATDWIGINQNSTTAGNSKLWYYLNGLTGTTAAPSTAQADGTITIDTSSLAPGTYYIYYCINNGYSYYTKTSFTVTGTNPTMTLNKTTCPQGDTINATFTGGVNNTDWICINQYANRAGYSKLWYYLNGTTTAPTNVVTNGTVAINTSSLTPGTYYVYYCTNDTYDYSVKTSFTVTAGATVSANKTTCVRGDSVTVTFTGARDAWDMISFYKSGNTYNSIARFCDGSTGPTAEYPDNNPHYVPNGSITFDTSSLSAGTYTIYLSNVGSSNGSYASTTLTITE